MNVTPTAIGVSYGPLVEIFSHAGWDGKVEGGELVDWTSNNHLARLSTVCKAWLLPAHTVLFRSVSISGERQARQFLQALARRPALAQTVRRLTIGLGTELEYSNVDSAHARESAYIVQVLLACPNVEHLQVRPLHGSVRPQLLAAITSRRLISLVLTPRLTHGSAWSRGMWYSTDHRALLLPTLRHLELDFWTGTPPRLTPTGSLSSPLTVLPLIEIRLASDVPEEIVRAILTVAGPTLHTIDIYSEQAYNIESLATALSHCTSRVVDLRYLSNPVFEQLDQFDGIVPLFDRLLPHFSALTHLSMAATDVSTKFFRLLPPGIVEVEIQSLSEASKFVFDQELLDDLADPSLSFTLEVLIVRDIMDRWTTEEAEDLTEACARRNFDFVFLPDLDSPSSSE